MNSQTIHYKKHSTQVKLKKFEQATKWFKHGLNKTKNVYKAWDYFNLSQIN